MSFIGNLFNEIDRIGIRTFKNDVIKIDLNKSARVFLTQLRPNEFISTNLASPGSRGIKIIKTDYNSINDSLNPEFLLAIKKSAVEYMNILARAQWRECIEGESNIPKKIYKLAQNPKCRFYIHEFENMGDTHAILNDIIIIKQIKILVMGVASNIIIGGEEKDLSHFFNTLENESMEFKNCEMIKKAL